jgi:predicted nucleotidyltransferase
MSHELKQVDVRLKLVDREGVYSQDFIDTPEKAVSLMAPILAELDREEVCVVNLDNKGHPINYNVVSIGTVNSSLVTGRELYKSAILSNAASMIMLHNHPSSDLSMSVMDRNVTEKMMYAGILLDINFLDHVIVAGGTGKMLSLREEYPYLFDKSSYSNQIVHVADSVKEEVSYQGVPSTAYEILQIKSRSNGEPYRFRGMKYVQKKELIVHADDYESVYQGTLQPGESLDSLYAKFNLNHPKGFTGHSLSVSDVIVMETESEKKAFYVDSVGFYPLQDFFAERYVHTEKQKQVIDTFREQTGRFFRPVEGKSAKEIENEVREFLMDKIIEYDVPIQLGEVVLYGSRCRGTEKETSDIDIVVEYHGNFREDDLFHLFHEENFCMGDIKVDINPIQKEKSGNIVEFLGRAAYYMEQELAFSIADRYITIQDATEGYEYTIYGADFQEIDGGVYDNPDISIYEAVNEIVEDLKQHPDTNGTKGSIEKNSVLVPLNMEEFEEAVEKHNDVPSKITFLTQERQLNKDQTLHQRKR